MYLARIPSSLRHAAAELGTATTNRFSTPTNPIATCPHCGMEEPRGDGPAAARTLMKTHCATVAVVDNDGCLVDLVTEDSVTEAYLTRRWGEALSIVGGESVGVVTWREIGTPRAGHEAGSEPSPGAETSMVGNGTADKLVGHTTHRRADGGVAYQLGATQQAVLGYLEADRELRTATEIVGGTDKTRKQVKTCLPLLVKQKLLEPGGTAQWQITGDGLKAVTTLRAVGRMTTDLVRHGQGTGIPSDVR